MKASEHILYGGAASAALYPALGWETAFFFVGSVLIDLDHYIDYLYYSGFKNWSVRTMFKFHGVLARWKERQDLLALEAFHTAEFLIALLACGLYLKSSAILLLFSGMIFHLALDLIRLRQWGKGKIQLRALSFVEYWVRAEKMKKSGVHPEKIFEEAYRAAVQAS